jgi:hypothetical protein
MSQLVSKNKFHSVAVVPTSVTAYLLINYVNSQMPNN